MTQDFPYDDEPPFDVTDAAAPPDIVSEPGPDAEPAMVPVPTHAVAATMLPIPRARRQLKAETETLKTAMANLKRLELGDQAELNSLAIDALVCATLDRQFPLDEDHPHIGRRREQAMQGKLTAYIPLAMDELEDVLATLEAALAALKAISLLDEPIPGDWGNLHPILLARKLNGLGHVLLRGRIAGVNL